MPDEGSEHPRSDSASPNAARCRPMPEVRRTPEEELAGPSFVAGRAQPIGKPLEVRANRTLPELTPPELALDVELQHHSLLVTAWKRRREGEWHDYAKWSTRHTTAPPDPSLRTPHIPVLRISPPLAGAITRS